ncbi:MAG: [FeFe] hydrogenase H-cluster radical SAM maturase HydG [Pirellulales bacterium]|nr:[FeFe] hydrogenase H-cluster radical SAM maturase HydG [Pirellulales bacterium]
MSCAIDRKKLSRSGGDFIDEAHLHELLRRQTDPGEVRDVIAKSLAKRPLQPEEAAVLLATEAPDLIEQIFDAARQLKRDVYGNRIVLFAPLYIGNECTNDCQYCAFRRSNREQIRRTLSPEELRRQVVALEDRGHKRLIVVFGEHPRYDAAFMAECVRQIYSIKSGHGVIRRVNVNAAPLDHEGYKILKAVGIGTYQIFQETYHHETYAKVHPKGTLKSDYLWRLDGLARAMEGGCDDVGLGVLFGLYDWRFEVLGLVTHALHLQEHYHCGPHTISFPRLRPAQGVQLDESHLVGDHEFKRLVAILRLSVPYTGLILTAREPPEVRREVMEFGVSQIDAGSRIELGGYTEAGDAQSMEREQFQLGDIRPLDDVVRELMIDGFIPSFCTACYRLGRTGEHFMEFAIPGFIQNFCTPNALTTLMEYLVDYASPETRTAGEAAIRREVEKLTDGDRKQQLLDRLHRIAESNERDLYY